MVSSDSQISLAGMQPSDILDVAKAGIEFYEHQRELDNWQQGVRRSKRGHNKQEDHLHLRER